MINCRIGIAPLPIQTINDTIDYAAIADLIKQHFEIPVDLLETLAHTISRDIHQQFPQVKYLNLSIKKMNPPLPLPTESSEICLEINF